METISKVVFPPVVVIFFCCLCCFGYVRKFSEAEKENEERKKLVQSEQLKLEKEFGLSCRILQVEETKHSRHVWKVGLKRWSTFRALVESESYPEKTLWLSASALCKVGQRWKMTVIYDPVEPWVTEGEKNNGEWALESILEPL